MLGEGINWVGLKNALGKDHEYTQISSKNLDDLKKKKGNPVLLGDVLHCARCVLWTLHQGG